MLRIVGRLFAVATLVFLFASGPAFSRTELGTKLEDTSMLPNAEVNVELIEERNEVLSEAVESIVDLLSGALDEGVDEINASGLLHLLSPSFAHSGPMDHVEAGHGPKGPRRGACMVGLRSWLETLAKVRWVARGLTDLSCPKRLQKN